MAKEPRQFRKGTKSCVECRQRKLRCILPPGDEGNVQACQNCLAKGRNCVLQVNAGRSSEAPTVTSRDRIRQLEGQVGKLWSVVRELRGEGSHTQSELSQSHDRQTEEHYNDGSDSDTSETSPMNPPAHLQQLFDNQIVDTQGSTITSPESNTDKSLSALMLKARAKLKVLIPPVEDVQAIAPLTQAWFAIYNLIFPPFTMFKTVDEILTKYDGLLQADASPIMITALLLWMAIAAQIAPPELLRSRSELMKDGPRFVRQVSDTVEDAIVTNDVLAGSVEGLEISLLWVRIQLSRAHTSKVWLSLRRCIALAELIGLPRAARVVHSTAAINPNAVSPQQEAAAAVWESICVVDRISGVMFNLPLGTAAHGFPTQQTLVSPDGQIIIKAFISNLARMVPAIQDIDDTYQAQHSDIELFDKVYKVDQEFRSLRTRVAETWWSLGPQHGLPDHLMQYWYYYLTIRTHLQLALRNSVESQCAYSYLTCTQACRELASRYVRLRSLLPLTFFAGRIIDLEALTAAVFLIYTSHRAQVGEMFSVPDQGYGSSQELAYEIVQMMESVCAKAPNNVGCDVARKGSRAIRRLDELLSQPAHHSQELSIKIPLLGKVNVNRSPKSSGRSFSTEDSPYQGQSETYQYVSQPTSAGTESAPYDPMSWSMDLMNDVDFFAADQWLWFSDA